jgi:hypothetical protein
MSLTHISNLKCLLFEFVIPNEATWIKAILNIKILIKRNRILNSPGFEKNLKLCIT